MYYPKNKKESSGVNLHSTTRNYWFYIIDAIAMHQCKANERLLRCSNNAPMRNRCNILSMYYRCNSNASHRWNSEATSSMQHCCLINANCQFHWAVLLCYCIVITSMQHCIQFWLGTVIISTFLIGCSE